MWINRFEDLSLVHIHLQVITLLDAFLIQGGCGILLLTKLGGYLFDHWTAGAPFYIMGLFNVVALLAALGVILLQRTATKVQTEDPEQSPLLSGTNVE
jgi:hypothetical protein